MGIGKTNDIITKKRKNKFMWPDNPTYLTAFNQTSINGWHNLLVCGINKGRLQKKKYGFKDIVPKGGRGSGPNPKISCMWN